MASKFKALKPLLVVGLLFGLTACEGSGSAPAPLIVSSASSISELASSSLSSQSEVAESSASVGSASAPLTASSASSISVIASSSLSSQSEAAESSASVVSSSSAISISSSSVSNASVSSSDQSSSSAQAFPKGRFVSVIKSVDLSAKIFQAYDNSKMFDYSGSGFAGDLEEGDVVEFISAGIPVDGQPLSTVDTLSLINNRTVTYNQLGLLSLVSSDGGVDLYGIRDSDIAFELSPDAEYGGTTHTDFITQIASDDVIISGALIEYSKSEGFNLKRLILDKENTAGRVENITFVDSPEDNFDSPLATVTVGGQNYIIEKSTSLENSRFVSDDQLTLETIKVGQYVALSFWEQETRGLVLSALATDCEFGIEIISQGNIICAKE